MRIEWVCGFVAKKNETAVPPSINNLQANQPTEPFSSYIKSSLKIAQLPRRFTNFHYLHDLFGILFA